MKLRYIFIPLGILLYIWWGCVSIETIKHHREILTFADLSATIWCATAFLLGTFGIGFIGGQLIDFIERHWYK